MLPGPLGVLGSGPHLKMLLGEHVSDWLALIEILAPAVEEGLHHIEESVIVAGVDSRVLDDQAAICL